MRLLRNSFAALILLGPTWVIGMRVSAPYRHNREFTSKLPFFQKIISDLQTSETAPSKSLTKVPVPHDAREMAYSLLRSAPPKDALR